MSTTGNREIPERPSNALEPEDVDTIPFDQIGVDETRYLMIRKDVSVEDNVTETDVFGIAFGEDLTVPLEDME